MGEKKRAPIVRWRGLLAQRTRLERGVIVALLSVACLSLSCCQLGFAGIGQEGNYEAYAVVLLLPIALGALLLGTLWGTFVGLVAGTSMLLHAQSLPLDYFELTFVTPLTSIVMSVVIGFLLGVLFAFALRNNPGPVKSALYIVIVCFIVSLLYSIGFLVNVVIQLALDLAAGGVASLSGEEQNAYIELSVVQMALRMGDMGLQILVDAALMSIVCVIADLAVRKINARTERIGLRNLFATWLFVVVLFAFFITTGVSFAAITQKESADAVDDIKGDVNYLCNQLEQATLNYNALEYFVDSAKVDVSTLTSQEIDAANQLTSIDSLLKGYLKDDNGTIVLAYRIEEDDDPADYVTVLSNGGRFEKEKRLGEYLNQEVLEAIADSSKTGEVERIVYDDANKSVERFRDNDYRVRSYIAFLYSQEQDDYFVTMILPMSKVFEGRGSIMLWTALSEFVLLLAVFAAIQLLLSRVLVRRIDETNSVLARITGGDLDARVNVRDTSELESLTEGINDTVDALKGWISEAETRMDAELATAKDIQESALPRTFPPFPSIPRFDIYASMHAAREVGGDFYDFFLIGDDCTPEEGRLGFVIADVSGKGVPAALFMMKAMAQVRGYMESGMEIGEAIENANRQLVDGNDKGMFVTVWAGILDYATGHVDYVNAGHNPPLLWQGEGGWRWLEERSGMPLGLFDGFGYDAYSLECRIGDQFLLYTDGVTEAMSVDGELYGEERLMALVTANFALHPRMLLEAVRSGVARHAEGAEQSDDITILSLEVGVPPEATATLVVPADVRELPHVNDFIHTELDRRLCPVRAQNQLDIAVEELFVNVCHYAYPDATPDNPGSVRVSYTYSADPPSVQIDIVDDGIPYNPLEAPDAVLHDDIESTPIGGLGLFMAKRSVNSMAYERVDGSNVVTIEKRW